MKTKSMERARLWTEINREVVQPAKDFKDMGLRLLKKLDDETDEVKKRMRGGDNN